MTTAIQVKEHPILFSTPMVEAILEGRKTLTRRVVSEEFTAKIQDYLGGEQDTELAFAYLTPEDFQEEGMPESWYVYCAEYPDDYCRPLGNCRYGKPGDRFWVRETFCKGFISEDGEEPAEGEPVQCFYKAGGNYPEWHYDFKDSTEPPWKPSIHMPRAASRILLEVVSIRIERLQDISEDDALAEGIDFLNVPTGGDDYQDYYRDYSMPYVPEEWPWIAGKPIESFRTLWQSINGPDSWQQNPWVWVVEFKVLEDGSGSK